MRLGKTQCIPINVPISCINPIICSAQVPDVLTKPDTDVVDEKPASNIKLSLIATVNRPIYLLMSQHTN